MAKKLITPQSVLIEETARNLATTFYEVGRSQGLTSKCKNAKEYARKNLERFIPRAVDILIDMLKPTSNCTDEMRMLIYEAFQERHNDPDLVSILPNVDVRKVLALREEMERKKAPIELKAPTPKNILHKDYN